MSKKFLNLFPALDVMKKVRSRLFFNGINYGDSTHIYIY